MANAKSVEIIKGAILMEHQGKAFYETVAKTATHVAVREIFQSMAIEEKKHIEMLSSQYVSLMKSGHMNNIVPDGEAGDFASKILNADVRKEISGAGYEAAAIGAALNMEKNAVEYYGARAQSATDPGEKKLYEWLSDWEKTHLDILVTLDRELRESVWYDQGFWPIG